MANFATLSAAETRCRQLIVNKVWVVAHSARNFTGQIIARFQRYMSPANPDRGAWTETQDDTLE